MSFDLIGDIHGHAEELVALLAQLGYQLSDGRYRHPTRTAIFVGDFIDRGPQIRDVLQIVRPMVERGAAFAVMGNHELNAIAYHTADRARPGHFLRSHSESNRHQHGETLRQLSESEISEAVHWFRTLPLWLDLPGLRVVHACWDADSLDIVKRGLADRGGVTSAFMEEATNDGGSLFRAVEVLLKGKEIRLPDGIQFSDKDGLSRKNARIRWYAAPKHQTYRSYSLPSDTMFPDVPLRVSDVEHLRAYPSHEKPVFFGHYWLKADCPSILAPNVCCLDFSIAKHGMLCAYRWSGETILSDDRWVHVTAKAQCT